MNEQLRKNIADAEMHFFREADPEIIREYIDECGEAHPDYLAKRARILNRIKFLAKASANKERDNQLLAAAKKCKEAIENNIDKPIQFLRGLMAGKAAAYNNNLEKLSQEEIIDLIKDQNLVNLLDQLQQDGSDIETKI